ncbi:MAG: hypothetical protein H6810_05145 [Phycisphaeraceae bacterium]|nr:MAG: hypothetical protein H6810_05145 [Phycisphaeraceae bacterium]
MEAIPPTLPFALAKTYGVQSTVRVRPVTPVSAVQGSEQAARSDARTARLVAGVVPGGVSFEGDSPRPTAETIPFYRHPADKNAAATSVNLGRVVDTSG